MAVLRGATLWRTWFGRVSAGELAGFAVPATVGATMIGALVAWLAGMTPGYAWPVVQRMPWPVLAAGGLLLGTVLLLSIGVAQWYVLRDLLPRACWWVVATAVAWLAGLVAFVAASTPLWRPGQRWPVVALIGVLAGAVMAATMAAVTGTALVRLTRTAPVSPGWSPASR